MASAATWSMLGQLALFSARFITFFIVPHFLLPADYGVFGFSLLFVGLFQLLIEQVVPMAVVQSTRPVAQIARITMRGALLVAAAGYAIMCGFAIPAAHMLRDHRVTLLFPIMGTQLFMSALYSTQVGMLQRNLAFRRIFSVKVIGVIPSATITILLAVSGHGYWALVVGWLSSGFCQMIATWVTIRLPKRLPYDRMAARELYGFSKWVTVDVVANWGLEYGPGFFIGTALGAASLGTFRLADQIIRATCAVALDPLTPVVYSTFSAIRRDGDDPLAALPRLNHIFGSISIPICGAFILAAIPLSLLMGPHWKGTAIVFLLDSVAWGINYLVQAVPQLFRAIGRPALVALIRVPLVVIQVIVLIFAARGGMAWFLTARIGVELLMITLTGIALVRALQLPAWNLLTNHARSFVLTVLSIGVSYLLGDSLPHAAVLPRLLLEISTFAGLSILIASRDPDSYAAYVASFLRSRKPDHARG